MFLGLIPDQIKVTDLTKADLQTYIHHRRAQVGKQTGQPIDYTTIYKELSQITNALSKREEFYHHLASWKLPKAPAAPKGLKRKSQRKRIVTRNELAVIIKELRREPSGSQNWNHYFHRVRLADTLEFAFWTGLRRKEISNLKFSQFDPDQEALLNVKRWKTGDIAEVYPLAIRAIEIINKRRELQNGTQYIFTPNGRPIESVYRTLKNVCMKLGVNYGRFDEFGFVPHDLIRNFGTENFRDSYI